MSALACVTDSGEPVAIFHVIPVENAEGILQAMVRTRKLEAYVKPLPVSQEGTKAMLATAVEEMAKANPGLRVEDKPMEFIDVINQLINNEMITKSKLDPAQHRILVELENQRVKKLAESLENRYDS